MQRLITDNDSSSATRNQGRQKGLVAAVAAKVNACLPYDLHDQQLLSHVQNKSDSYSCLSGADMHEQLQAAGSCHRK